MNHCKIIALALIFLTVFSLSNTQQAESRGLGVGPNYIKLDSAFKNTTYKHPIYIFNENDYDIEAELEISGEPKNWTKFYKLNTPCCPINSINIKNNSNLPVDCKISIPADLANGVYHGMIYVKIKPNENITADSNYSSVDLSIPIELYINVTGIQEYNVSIDQILVKSVEIGYPATIKVFFKNNGNVQASPKIDVTITKDGNYIDKISSDSNTIEPGNINTHIFEWDTIGKVSGKYNAYFEIYGDNNLIAQKNVSFELLPPGTIERNGTLKDIIVEGTLEKGKVGKIIATFSNIGAIDLEAQFFGEIYLNGDLIGTIESQQVKVSKYKNHQFVSYLNIEHDGEYTVKGYVLYGGLPTETKELHFNVGFKTSDALMFLAVLSLIIFFVYLLYCYTKGKKTVLTRVISYKLKRVLSKRPTLSTFKKDDDFNFEKDILASPKKKRRMHFKKKEKKPAGLSIEKMSAKEIEDYVKSL